MKKNDNTKPNGFISFYRKLNERCNKFLNELLDDKPRTDKSSLLDTIRAKFKKCKAKDTQ